MAENKEIKEKFKKFKSLYLMKTHKKTNVTYILDRIRGVKNVVVAQVVKSSKLDDITRRNNNFTFHLLKIKFMTNVNPSNEAQKIASLILHGESGESNVVGVAFIKPKLDTVTPV